MANFGLPFRCWSSISPSKKMQQQCNNTSSGGIIDKTLGNAKAQFPLDKPSPCACKDSKDNVELVTNKATTDPIKNKPCCQYPQHRVHKVISKVYQSGGPKGGTQKFEHRLITVKSLVYESGPDKALVNIEHGQTCHQCKKYEIDKATPIEKLIAATRIDANLCAKCECHAKVKEANYLQPKGEVKRRNNRLPTPLPDNCCTEECVGKRVYNKPAASNRKKLPSAIHFMDWPWYWAKYYPTAASRVAKRIIQAKADAHEAITNLSPVGEFEACFLPPERRPLRKLTK